MGYRHCCVIDAENHYVTFVLVVDDVIQNYTLRDGEQLVDTAPPASYVKPAWDGAAWTESAAAEEVTAAEARLLSGLKAAKIAGSKTQLAEYLAANPLTYTDGKRYSVTAEKQSLLTSALARYQIATASGVAAALKWNSTGEECTVWEYDDLAALALAIAAYVEPLVAQQQAAEVAINACATVDEVKAITVAYGS